jgi:hypothetical protein
LNPPEALEHAPYPRNGAERNGPLDDHHNARGPAQVEGTFTDDGREPLIGR